MRRHRANAIALYAHSGPEFEYWRARTAASVGAVILDEPRPEP